MEKKENFHLVYSTRQLFCFFNTQLIKYQPWKFKQKISRICTKKRKKKRAKKEKEKRRREESIHYMNLKLHPITPIFQTLFTLTLFPFEEGGEHSPTAASASTSLRWKLRWQLQAAQVSAPGVPSFSTGYEFPASIDGVPSDARGVVLLALCVSHAPYVQRRSIGSRVSWNWFVSL